jgi:sugar lactone lactonase YvrE
MGDTPVETDRSLEVAADINADLGEGPIWDDETATLLFVDSSIGRIYRFEPVTGGLKSWDVGQPIGVAVPRRQYSRGLVASGRDGILSVAHNGDVEVLAAIEPGRATRLNDAKCDSRGRLWSGSISLQSERRACALYRVDADLTVTRAQDGVSVSNGIAWSPDEKTMYYVDTLARGIDAFDYDLETGAATNRRRLVDIERADGLPDGITVDSEGCIWLALYLGGAVRRYSPDGQLVEHVAMPVTAVTSCGFGGPQLTDLYVTTAQHGLSEAQLAKEQHAGALFRFRPGVTGLPTMQFAG